MKILDSDNYALKDKLGRNAARDIVQFVDYSEHQNKVRDKVSSSGKDNHTYEDYIIKKKNNKGFKRRDARRKT
jgi:hypothetical protein